MSTTVAGIRFSDQLGALLDHAVANGWRVERDERGRNAKGVVVYSPDKDHPPIAIDERNARFNRSHYENIRRDLYRHGLPPLPADAKPTITATPAVAQALGGTVVSEHDGLGIAADNALATDLSDPEKSPELIGSIVNALVVKSGIGIAEAALISSLVENTAQWAHTFGADRLDQLRTEVEAGLAAKHKREMQAATELAEEAERRAVAAERAREKAEARGADTGRQLTEALERASAAEAEARRLRDALAPLRALMTATDA